VTNNGRVPHRSFWAALLTLLCYVAGFFSLYCQVSPYLGAGDAMPLLSAGTGGAFGLAAFLVAGDHSPRNFALVGIGLAALAGALAGIVLRYA
jgi:hypothetical protein